MDPIGFMQALQDLMPLGDLLDVLVEDWHNWLSEAIEEIASQCPLYSHPKLAPGYTSEL